MGGYVSYDGKNVKVKPDNAKNGFSQLNSILNDAANLKPKKPPRLTKLGGIIFPPVLAFNSDFTSVLAGIQFFPPSTIFFTYEFWGGPFSPVWRTYPLFKAVKLIIYLWNNPGHSFYQDVSGLWQNQFGTLPTDPGYLAFAQTFVVYGSNGEGTVLTNKNMIICPVNGAPPYKP